MSLQQQLLEYVASGFSGVWIQTYESAQTESVIREMCRPREWGLAEWDADRGYRFFTYEGEDMLQQTQAIALPDAIKSVLNLGATDELPNRKGFLILKNLHRFIDNAAIMQAMVNTLEQAKSCGAFLIVLAPVVQIPAELEKLFIVLEHDLPTRDELWEIAKELAEPSELPGDVEGRDRLLDAAAGLTRFEMEGAVSLSIVRHKQVQPAELWDIKSQMLKKSGLLSLYKGTANFAGLGGLEPLKEFCLQALNRNPGERSGKSKPRGVLMAGLPGSGKSEFVKGLGHATGRETIVLDPGSLMGSHIGDSESNTRKVLKLVDAMAPAVLMIDEVEKGLSGVGSSNETDGGTSARVFGTILTWLNDHTSDIFVCCTANDVSKLPPEFARAERFDGIFFLDLPNKQQQEQIWNIYREYYEIKDEIPEVKDWTGAEIKSCCRLADLLEIPLEAAARQIVPVAVSSAEKVNKLRAWAEGRCLSADFPGIYYKKEYDNLARSGKRLISRETALK